MTEAPTPTETFTKSTSKLFDVTDAKGRKISCRDLGALDGYRLLKALGQHSSNSGAVRYAQVAHCVTAIDSIPVPAPNSDRDIERILEQLGDEGFVAVWAQTEVRAKAMMEAAEASVDTAKN